MNFYKAYIWSIHDVSFVYCPWETLWNSRKLCATQIEIGSIEIGYQGKQANRVALSHISRYFSTIGFPIHVNLIAAVKSLRRRQYAGIKKSVRGAEERSLAAWFILAIWSEGCCARGVSRISRFPSPLAPRLRLSRTRSSPQVRFKCLRNRRFCPSSDEHHCLSICLSVYRIDIRESGRIEEGPVLSSFFFLVSVSLFFSFFLVGSFSKLEDVLLCLYERSSPEPCSLFCSLSAAEVFVSMVRWARWGQNGEFWYRILQDLFIYLPILSSVSPFSLFLLQRGFSISRSAPFVSQTTETGLPYWFLPEMTRTPKSISRSWTLLRPGLVSNWMDARLVGASSMVARTSEGRSAPLKVRNTQMYDASAERVKCIQFKALCFNYSSVRI